MNELFKYQKYLQNDRPTYKLCKNMFILIPKKQQQKKKKKMWKISYHKLIITCLKNAKSMLRVVEKNIRDTLSENQFGIKKNMSTREAISILGIIIENEYEKINRHLLPLLTLNRR